MSDIIGEAIGAVEATVDALVHDAEELFPPRPGGMVDRHRKQKAAEEAAREAGRDSDVAELGRDKVRAVRTVVESPDLGGTPSVVLSSGNPVLRLLPRDSHRKAAVILAIDNDVYLTTDEGLARTLQGNATGAGGFYLPAGTPIPVTDTAEWWAAATTTATTSRVSVMVNRESAS
jgi:hypothetical protein